MKIYRKHTEAKTDLFLLHGGPGAVGELHDLALMMKELDMPATEHFQNAFTIEGLVNELNTLLDKEADGKAVLIGHSWGAWLAWIFTALHPERVKGLVLIASGSFEPDYNIDLTQKRIEKLPFRLQNEAVDLLNRLKSSYIIKENDFKRLGELMERADTYCSALTDYSMKPTLLPNQHQSIWDEAQQLRHSGTLLNYAREIKCPVVAFHGDFDSHPAEGVEIPLRNKLSDFRMIRLKACGHYPWREKYAKDVFLENLKNVVINLK